MSAKFTDKQLADLLAGIADGLPIGALAGVAGVSSPTITSKLHNAEFIEQLAGTVREYDADTCKLLERLEHWWNYPGEGDTLQVPRPGRGREEGGTAQGQDTPARRDRMAVERRREPLGAGERKLVARFDRRVTGGRIYDGLHT